MERGATNDGYDGTDAAWSLGTAGTETVLLEEGTSPALAEDASNKIAAASAWVEGLTSKLYAAARDGG